MISCALSFSNDNQILSELSSEQAFIKVGINIPVLHMQGDIHHVINPDPYHGVFGSDSYAYARDVQDFIDYGTSGKIAGFIAETIQVLFFTLLYVSKINVLKHPTF